MTRPRPELIDSQSHHSQTFDRKPQENAMGARVIDPVHLAFEDGGCVRDKWRAGHSAIPAVISKIERLAIRRTAGKGFGEIAVMGGEHVDCEDAIAFDRFRRGALAIDTSEDQWRIGGYRGNCTDGDAAEAFRPIGGDD